MYLIFDTETIGLPTDFNAHYSDVKNWETARCVQLAWQLVIATPQPNIAPHPQPCATCFFDCCNSQAHPQLY